MNRDFVRKQIEEGVKEFVMSSGDVLQLLNYIESLEKSIKAKQALVDALMLEFCPEEMTDGQIEELRKNQKRIKGETENGGNTCE